QVRPGAGDRSRSDGITIAPAGEDRSLRHDPVFRTALRERRGADGMALDASDERRQGRTIENGACRLAEKNAGAIYVQLETGADLTRIPVGCRPMNQRKTIRIGVIADSHGLFDPVV